jgi:hypothetical protein
VEAGTLKHSLIVGQSLNNRQAQPSNADPQLAIASYHSQMDIAENTFVGFQNGGYVLNSNGWDKSSGTFGTDDYYIRPVEMGFWRNPGNRLIQSDPGYRALPPHLQPNFTVESRNHWTLAGALWDPHGLWGQPGRFWVLDTPFLRDESCSALLSIVPAGRANGLSCAGPYFGVHSFSLNRGLPGATNPYVFLEKLDVTRTGADGLEKGRWVIEAGHDSRFLGHMRHFAAMRGDAYVVRFPNFPQASETKSPPRWLQLLVEGLLRPGDSVLLGLHFDGSVTPSRVMASTKPDYPEFEGIRANARLMRPAASRDEVIAGAGDLYWQDSANHLVWVKAVPFNLSGPWLQAAAGSDDDLYRSFHIRIEP